MFTHMTVFANKRLTMAIFTGFFWYTGTCTCMLNGDPFYLFFGSMTVYTIFLSVL